MIAHLGSFRRTVDARAAYVAISRARDHATLSTDSRTRLAEALGLRSGNQVAALDQDIGREKGRTIAMPDAGAGLAIDG